MQVLDAYTGGNMNNPLVNKLLILVLGLAAGYLIIRFGFWLIGLMMPFVVGFLLASAAQPIRRLLQERVKFPNALASGVSLLIVISVVGGLLYFLFIGVQNAIPGLTSFFEGLWGEMMIKLRNLYWTLQYRYPEVFLISFDELSAQLTAPGNILSLSPTPILSTVFNFARSLPAMLLYLIISLISSYYISLEYTSVYTYLKKRLLERPVMSRFVGNMRTYTKSGLLSWLKAQAIIMSISGLTASIFFAFMGNNSPIALGIFLAVFDGLPIFGAGAVLWPMAIYHLIYANYTNAILTVILYLVIVAARNFIEPRIIGKHIGINPLVTLLTIYLGFRLMGVMGIILGVILLVIGASVYNGHKSSKQTKEP